jgi:holin (3TMs family)
VALDLASILGKSLGETFKDAVGAFKADPTVKLQLEAAVEQNKAIIEQKQIDLQAKIADALSSEVNSALAAYKAEQTGDDKYTKRWRPTFGYMVTILLFWNFAIAPLFGRTPVIIPDRLFQMFGALLLVAIGGRTFEKIFGNGK